MLPVAMGSTQRRPPDLDETRTPRRPFGQRWLQTRATSKNWRPGSRARLTVNGSKRMGHAHGLQVGHNTVTLLHMHDIYSSLPSSAVELLNTYAHPQKHMIMDL